MNEQGPNQIETIGAKARPGRGLSAVVLLILLGIGIFWISKNQPSENESGAKVTGLSVSPRQQHLGKLNQHESRDFSFEISNNTGQDLRILQVEHSCGCTETKVEKESLAPGEKTRILGSLAAQDRVGEFGSEIRVKYRTGFTGLGQGEEQEVKMLVGARAVTLINLPGHVDLGETLLGEQPKAVSLEVSRGEAEQAWDHLELKTETLQSKLVKTGEGRWQVTLTAPRGEVVGSQREKLSFELSNSKNPGHPVNAARPDDFGVESSASWKTTSEHFSLSPSGVYLSGDKPVRVKVKSQQGRPVQVSQIEIPAEAPVQARSLSESGQTWLEFRSKEISPTAGQPNQQAPWSGKIQVNLRDGLVEEKH
ncbi:MAG: DUF1573 domain-containing protein, partial [Blastochloris sp.]|nr:DUF1573 domain-containing protein [Blastochloris sp.]